MGADAGSPGGGIGKPPAQYGPAFRPVDVAAGGNRGPERSVPADNGSGAACDGPATNRTRPGTDKLEPRLVSLDRLSHWQIAESIEHRQRRFFSIVGCRVEGQDREVTSWDQPLLAPAGPGQCTLLIRPGLEGPELLVSERVRIGSVRGPSLEARFQRGDIADHATESRRRSMVAEASGLARCHEIHSAVHAEEGGRFRGAVSVYQLGLFADAPRGSCPVGGSH
ncbi:hypothetical protein D3C59_17820 [Streptomyces sp. SHP22-7]|nr:hypothetical protein D3C59_17820 [Streptomyces sp. SHP22-7]